MEGLSRPMEISIINSIPYFLDIKKKWDAVYTADPNSHFFMSWQWVMGWLKITPYQWFILAIRPECSLQYKGFLPFTVISPLKPKLGGVRELHLGGKPLAEYTGFLCIKEYEEELLANLASYIQDRLNWDIFYLTDVLDSRLPHFLQYFDPKEYLIREIDSLCCPFISLPSSWNYYLKECLNGKCRHDLLRYLRRFDMLNECNEISTNSNNLESQINIFLAFLQQRWGKKPESFLRLYRDIFLECFENKCLYLVTLWNSKSPIAAFVALIDQKKRIFHAINFSWNDKYARFAPGKIIIARSIKYAIQNGFEIFDFCRGHGDIKFYFGSKERFSKTTVIIRKDVRTTFKRMMRKTFSFLST
jgi:hypothetical protein